MERRLLPDLVPAGRLQRGVREGRHLGRVSATVERHQRGQAVRWEAARRRTLTQVKAEGGRRRRDSSLVHRG